ncbi:hypothetical protein AM1_C0334 (plasmid) [Acaryochloris marina MBIC11017]|uniref:Uncharacterized protein n=1 Tax=Acaryochloris marina (strain MBIC 11017) TaxID=329726 RepID=A8ZN62_ACAM1|nr:hypothetical protein AM1_C0334 [Acaryochloris marina MBIC11017]
MDIPHLEVSAGLSVRGMPLIGSWVLGILDISPGISFGLIFSLLLSQMPKQ